MFRVCRYEKNGRPVPSMKTNASSIFRIWNAIATAAAPRQPWTGRTLSPFFPIAARRN